MSIGEVIEDLGNLTIEELHPLSPEVIQRQATINIGIGRFEYSMTHL